MTETTYSRARANLAALCDEVAATREPALIRRRNASDVVLVDAKEFAGLAETAHLLRSPANARRLLTALERAERGTEPPMTMEALRREVGFEDE